MSIELKAYPVDGAYPSGGAFAAYPPVVAAYPFEPDFQHQQVGAVGLATEQMVQNIPNNFYR